MLGPGGSPVLIVSEDEADAARETDCEVATYPGFGIGPIDPVGAAARALREVVDGPTVAIDAGTLPAALALGLEWKAVDDALVTARAVKDPDEVELIRAAIAVCDAGQRAARAHAAAGVSELELWAAVRGAMEGHAGARLPVLADLVSGPRTAEVGGPPGPRALTEGDLVLCDLVPRLGGYWGDSCATFAVGEPSAEAVAAHARARATLDEVIAAVRPGAVAGELDALARASLEYPHHTGHGIGTGFHEAPRIIPGSPVVLEEGMIVALEPGKLRQRRGCGSSRSCWSRPTAARSSPVTTSASERGAVRVALVRRRWRREDGDPESVRRARMHRKFGVVVAVAIGVTAVLATAGLAMRSAATTTQAFPTEPVNLTMSWWGEQEAAGAKGWLAETVAAYQKKHPNVKIKTVLQTTDGLIPAFKAAAAAKKGPDIQYFWGGIWSLDDAWLGNTKPVSDYIPKSELAHYLNAKEDTFDGKVWTAPWYVQPSFPVLYRKDVLAKAGVAVPTSWAALLEVV